MRPVVKPLVVRLQVGHGRSVPVRIGIAHVSVPVVDGGKIVATVTLRVRRRHVAWGLARLGHPVMALRYLRSPK